MKGDKGEASRTRSRGVARKQEDQKKLCMSSIVLESALAPPCCFASAVKCFCHVLVFAHQFFGVSRYYMQVGCQQPVAEVDDNLATVISRKSALAGNGKPHFHRQDATGWKLCAPLLSMSCLRCTCSHTLTSILTLCLASDKYDTICAGTRCSHRFLTYGLLFRRMRSEAAKFAF